MSKKKENENQHKKSVSDTTHTRLKELHENAIKITEEEEEDRYGYNKEIINTNDIEISPKLIGKGNINPRLNYKKSVLIIEDTSTWSNLLHQFKRKTEFFTEINIDFENYTVIAIFDEIKGDTGHSVIIKKIIEKKDEIVLRFESFSRDMGGESEERPFLIIKISKSTKPIRYEHPRTIHTFAKGIVTGKEGIEASSRVITDFETWDKLLTKINSVKDYSKNVRNTVREHFFNNYYLFVIFDEAKPIGSHTIEITKIIESNDNIIVTIKNRKKETIKHEKSQSFHIVRIPKFDKPVLFEKE